MSALDEQTLLRVARRLDAARSELAAKVNTLETVKAAARTMQAEVVAAEEKVSVLEQRLTLVSRGGVVMDDAQIAELTESVAVEPVVVELVPEHGVRAAAEVSDG